MVKSPLIPICILFFLSLSTTQAQEATGVETFAYQFERNALLQQNRLIGTKASALRPERWVRSGTEVQVGYHTIEQDLYDWQKGSGERGVGFTAESYLRDALNRTTVWGNAYYTSQKVSRLNYNASLDYDRVFPYFLADSIGGEQQMEQYAFGGGLARQYKHWTFGTLLNIESNQAFRKMDPRPKNTSSVFHLEASAAFLLPNSYTLAFAAEGALYKQTNTLKYVSELGRPLIFNLNGMGVYNNLLTGTGRGSGTATAFFSASSIGSSITLMPKQKGLWLKGKFLLDKGNKQSPLSFEKTNNWTDHKIDAHAGYDGDWAEFQYTLGASWHMQWRKGREGLFTNQNAESGLIKIAEKFSYQYAEDHYRMFFSLGKRQWNVNIRGAVRNIQEQYISPYRMQKIQNGEVGIDVQYFWIWEKQLLSLQAGATQVFKIYNDFTFRNIHSETGLGQLLENNIHYLLQVPFVSYARLRWDMPSVKRWQPYISGELKYASAIRQKDLNVKVGFVF